jgi:tetratricopeptide (TPR) repeat protein
VFLGDFARAIAVLCFLPGVMPGFAQGWSRADAIALERQGQNAEAEEIWQSIAAVDPANSEAFAHLGLLEAKKDNYPAAIENYQKAMALRPAMPGLQSNLGLAYFKANQYTAAIRCFRGALEKEKPDSPAAHRLLLLLGMAHYGMGDYFVSIPYLRRAADGEPQSLPLRLTLARSCLWSKQYDCVTAVYREILALNADSAEAAMIAGEALDEKGDDAGAAERFRAAAKADPKRPNVHFGLGYLLWKQKHFAEAAREFRAELENDATQFLSRAYLGDSLVELNDFDAARPELDNAASESADPSALAMVHRDLGILYAAAGQKEKAVSELLKAIALDPADMSSHSRLAKVYQSMGKKEAAKAEFVTASAINRQNSRPLTQEIGQAGANSHP